MAKERILETDDRRERTNSVSKRRLGITNGRYEFMINRDSGRPKRLRRGREHYVPELPLHDIGTGIRSGDGTTRTLTQNETWDPRGAAYGPVYNGSGYDVEHSF